MSYLTVNRGTPKRETPIDVLHPSGANIGGGANRKHWGKRVVIFVSQGVRFAQRTGTMPPMWPSKAELIGSPPTAHTLKGKYIT